MSQSEPFPGFMDMLNQARNTYGDYTYNPDTDYTDYGPDIDAFEDAFDAVRQEFLALRVKRGNYLELGTQRMVKELRAAMERVEERYIEKRPAKSEDLIRAAMCAMEILSVKKPKGE